MESIVDVLINRVLYKRAHSFKTRSIPSLACFSGDFIGIQLALYGVYELEILDLVVGRLHDPDRAKGRFVIDVGANIGNHSVYLSRYFDEVHAVEPNPRTFALLKINAMASANITPINLAISNTPGRVRLVETRGNNGQSFLVDDPGQVSECGTDFWLYDVESRRLDDVMTQHDRCYLIKIDVEGRELEVLKSARNIIANSRPYILFEHHMDDFVDRSSPVLQMLHEQDYAFLAALRPYPYRGRRAFRKWANFLTGTVLGNDAMLTEIRYDDVEPDFYEMILAYPRQREPFVEPRGHTTQ